MIPVTRLTVAALACVFYGLLPGLPGGPAAQNKPKFSGRWVIVSPPKGVGQEQIVTADEKSLTTERPDGTRKTVYQLDGVERRMALPSGGTRSPVGDITIMAAAKWDGDRIVITTNQNYSNGMRLQSTETWTIDAQGQLVIDYTETGPGSPPTTTKVIYARKS